MFMLSSLVVLLPLGTGMMSYRLLTDKACDGRFLFVSVQPIANLISAPVISGEDYAGQNGFYSVKGVYDCTIKPEPETAARHLA